MLRSLAILAACALLALGALMYMDGSRTLIDVTPTPVANVPVGRSAAASMPVDPQLPLQPGSPAASAGLAHEAGTGAAIAAPAAAPAPAPAPTAATASTLLLPVQGITPDQLQDTFTDARSAGRRHDAIDIMAPAGTPVLAVSDGHVEKLFDSDRGGLTLYQFEPGGRLAYYYAHLQRYADDVAEGQAVRRGQVIGYVGSTGNASPEAPHLHFAIFELGPERRWWEGTAINPYPLLRGGEATPR
jgi:murein DD-endopeptidase MepM/ murein hydrolase activator NlpD